MSNSILVLARKTHFFEIILVFIMTIVAYGYFISYSDWNANSRMALTKAIIERKSFEIDGYESKDFETQDKASFQGHFYSDKAIGSSLLGVAPYRVFASIYYRIGGKILKVRIFKKLITFFAINLICAFLAPLIYSFARKISKHARFALLVTTVICLGTPFYRYATVYYGHSLAGLFLFVAFFIWFNIQSDTHINLVKVLISSYFLGYAIITEYPTAIIVFLIGLYILYVLWKKQRLFDWRIYTCLIASAAVPLLIAMAYNYVVFGNPFTTGYNYEAFPLFAKNQREGLMGIDWPNLGTLFNMTFHTTMGIFWQSPVLLLAFVGWVRMARESRYRAEAILSFCVILIYFLVMSGYYLWWGGSAFTPRSIIPVLPFFAIPLAFLVKKLERNIMLLLGLVAIMQMFMVAAANSIGLSVINQYIQNTSIATMFQHSVMYEIYIQNFFNQRLEVNLGSEFFHMHGFGTLVPLLVTEACVLVAFIKITPNGNDSLPKFEQQG